MGEFEDGESYYPVFIFYNELDQAYTLEDKTKCFIVDSSAPIIEEIKITGVNNSVDNNYLNDLSKLNLSVICKDDETNYELYYSLVRVDDEASTIWYSTIADLKGKQTLETDKKYKIRVKVENSLGLVSIKDSESFIFDKAGPEISIHAGNFDNETSMQKNNSSIKISWQIEDYSSIKEIYYKVGTSEGTGDVSQKFIIADPAGWVKIDESVKHREGYEITEEGQLFEDGTYYISLKAIDWAGNETVKKANSIKIDTSNPAAPDVEANPFQSETNRIDFTVIFDEPEGVIRSYEYRLLDEEFNQIVDWQKSIYSVKKRNLTLTGVELQHGNIYYIEVKAEYESGFSGSSKAKIEIDQTAPEITKFEYPSYTVSNINLNWDVIENDSSYNLYLTVGKTLNGAELMDKNKVEGDSCIISFDELTSGNVIYISLIAENQAGLRNISVSKPITIDNTNPPLPMIVDEGDFTNKNNQLLVSLKLSQEDPESTNDSYKYAVLTEPVLNNETEWNECVLDADKKFVVADLNLQENTIYYIAVEVTNKAGLKSIGFSDGIIVDTTCFMAIFAK